MKRYLLLIIVLLNSLDSNAQEIGLDQRIDEAFQPISDIFSKYVFYPVSLPFGEYPFVIYFLVGSALFFTIYFVFPKVNMIKLKRPAPMKMMAKFLIFKH
jgi:AGCS family alanine or glycine:cation symporter